MADVYISYRRDDAGPYARIVAKELSQWLGPDRVFTDTAIGLGQNFAATIQAAIRGCRVVLVLIGRQWEDARDRNGDRRLDDPDDFVRREIATALAAGIPTIPVLVDHAQFPSMDRLSPDIRKLMHYQGVDLSDARWDDDFESLKRAVGRLLDKAPRASFPSVTAVPEVAATPQPPPPAAAAADEGRDAFISHASEDHAYANAIVTALEKQGHRCWIAPRDIVEGSPSYARAITRAIRTSRLMIVLVSEHANASDDVLNEVTLAKNYKVPRLPVRIDTAPLDDGLAYFFSQSQWLDASALSQRDALARLLQSVAAHLP